MHACTPGLKVWAEDNVLLCFASLLIHRTDTERGIRVEAAPPSHMG